MCCHSWVPSTLYRAMFERSADAMLVVGASGRIVEANRAAELLFGYGSTELRDMAVSDLVPEDRRGAHSEAIRSYLEAPAPRVIGVGPPFLEALRKDGSRVPVEISLTPVELAEGGPLFAASVRDVSERARAAAGHQRVTEQVRHAQKLEAIGTLAGGIAHDFNNVLAVVFGNVELVVPSVPPGSPEAEALEEIRLASIRGRELVRQILAFSRRQTVTRRTVDLRETVDETLGLLRAVIPTGVELLARHEASTPLVLADATQIHQVLVNLCTNAWHAMDGRPGRVQIELADAWLDADACAEIPGTSPGRHACVTVTDDGCGIDAPTLERIFDPFFTTKPAGKGIGLGLSVVHGIVQDHGGGITVTSKPGEGATFRVYLPATNDAKAEAGREAPKASIPTGGGRHVLFLDDEPNNTRVTARLLRRLDYRTSTFTDPGDALAAFGADPGKFDVVITDVNMPGCSGIDVCKAVLTIRPDVPVLVVSGRLDEETKCLALAAGARQVLAKPWSMDDIAVVLGRLTESQS